MSGSVPSTPTPAAPWPDPATAAAARRRRRSVAAGVVGVVVLLGAVVAVWFVGFGAGRGDDRGAAGEANCGGGRHPVNVDRPAFTFCMPKGFRPAGAEIDWDPGIAKAIELQALAVVPPMGGDVDNIIVMRATEHAHAEDYTDADIERGRENSQVFGTAEGPTMRRTIDGARGWGYLFRPNSGGYHLAWQFFKNGASLDVDGISLNITCMWTREDLKDRITSACDQVLDTLTIG